MSVVAERIVDKNGKLTTVYKSADENGSDVSSKRLSAPLKSKAADNAPLASDLFQYTGGNYVETHLASSPESINDAISRADSGTTLMIVATDSSLGNDGTLTIEGGTNPVLLHLDTQKKADINITSGEVVVKAYGDRKPTNIIASGNSSVTAIIGEGCECNITSLDDSMVTVVPEQGARGIIHVAGENTVYIDGGSTVHKLLVVG